MAFKDEWKDKVDDVDDVMASDINGIANEVIRLENEKANTADVYDKAEIDEKIAEAGVNVDLSDYYTALQVDEAIQAAIGDVLGGAS